MKRAAPERTAPRREGAEVFGELYVQGIRLTPCDEARHGLSARRFGEKPGQRPRYLPAEPEETERAGRNDRKNHGIS